MRRNRAGEVLVSIMVPEGLVLFLGGKFPAVKLTVNYHSIGIFSFFFNLHLLFCFSLVSFRLYPSKMEDSFDCDCGELEPPDH